MSEAEKRLNEITGYLEAKGVEITEQDVEYFKGIIRLATNDGYRKATNIHIEEEQTMKYSLSRYCGECERDFVAGQVVNYTPLENRSFCDSCREKINTTLWERRVIPTEEQRDEILNG